MSNLDVELLHIVPTLNDKTAPVAKKLYESYKLDYCYPYSHFIDGEDITPQECKDFIQALKKLGIVKAYKGLRDDDGKAAGSGFGVVSNAANNLLELALYRYMYMTTSLEQLTPCQKYRQDPATNARIILAIEKIITEREAI